MDEVRRWLEKAKIDIMMEEPVLAALLSRLPVFVGGPAEAVGTACTDGSAIWFAEQFVRDEVEQAGGVRSLTFVLEHELMHVLHLHHLRRPPFASVTGVTAEQIRKIWHVAIDAKVNMTLAGSKAMQRGSIEPPKTVDGVFSLEEAFDISDDKLKEMTEEDVFNHIAKKVAEKNRQQGGDGARGQGDEVPVYDERLDDVRSPEKNDGDGNDKATSRRVLDEQAIAEVLADAAVILTTSQQASRTGDFVGAELVEKLLRPKMNPRQLLREYMQATTGDDEKSWRRRNRRVPDVVLPGRMSEELEKLVIVMDSSGSCWSYIPQMLTEMLHIVEEIPVQELVVMVHTTSTRFHQTWTKDEDIPLVLRELITKAPETLCFSGGTCCQDTVKTIKEQHSDATALVWMTDLYIDDWGALQGLEVPSVFVTVEAFDEGWPIVQMLKSHGHTVVDMSDELAEA